MLSSIPAAAINPQPEPPGIQVFIDGNPLQLDVAPVLEQDRTLVPLRAIFEALGAEVEWDQAQQRVAATKGSLALSLQIGSRKALKNGIQVDLDVPARLLNNRTMVPLRFVGEALGAEVAWDGEKRRIDITSGGSQESKAPSDEPSPQPDGQNVKAATSFVQSTKPFFSEQNKFDKIDFNNRLFRPVYKPKLTLKAADGYGTGGALTYSSAPYAAMIQSNGSGIHSFKWELPADVLSQTSKIIWQVSLVPFDGKPTGNFSLTPGGLLLSGSVSKQTKEFTIDFSKVKQAEDALRKPKQSSSQIIFKPNLSWNISQILLAPSAPQTVAPRTYYVRAYPVGGLGKSIGDTGAGLPVIYGDPLSSRKAKSGIFGLKFSLKPAQREGSVYYGKEFPNDFFDSAEVSLENYGSKSYSVLPSGFSSSTQELRLQVSLVNYPDDSWQNPAGIVYEKSIFPNDPVFTDLKNSQSLGWAIDFTKFVPPDDKLPNDLIPYYVRVVAFTKGLQPGTVSAQYSKTVCIKYGKPQVSSFKYYPVIEITPHMPEITKMSYAPIKWEAPGWEYHYTVIRQPSFKEVFGIGGNEAFTPYAVGTKLDFTPKPQDKSWWEEAWDTITGFFGDLVGFLSNLVNSISRTYENLKAELIKFVAQNLPLVPESLRGALEKALTALVDYGLASIGIPPTLPNFDELSEMGVDYLATVAMEQAGIPAADYIKYGGKELVGGIKDNMKSAANTSTPNPMNWDFIKHDSGDLYRPAYIMIELSNPSGEPTPSGKLCGRVERELNSQTELYDGHKMDMYAKFGGNTWYQLYKPVYGLTIPSLAPGQRLTIPVYLEEYVGIPYFNDGPVVDRNDFLRLYNYFGEFDFDFNIQYDLPSVTEEAKKQGYTEDAIYSYNSERQYIGFSATPYENHNYNK